MSEKILTRNDLATEYFRPDASYLIHYSSDGLIIIKTFIGKEGAPNNVVPVWLIYGRNHELVEKEIEAVFAFKDFREEQTESPEVYISILYHRGFWLPIDVYLSSETEDVYMNILETGAPDERAYLGVLIGDGYMIDIDDPDLSGTLVYALATRIGPVDPPMKLICDYYSRHPPKMVFVKRSEMKS